MMAIHNLAGSRVCIKLKYAGKSSFVSFIFSGIYSDIRVASVAVARVAGVALMALGFCVAGVAFVAFGDIQCHLARRAWHLET